jgi:hypothetical protein
MRGLAVTATLLTVNIAKTRKARRALSLVISILQVSAASSGSPPNIGHANQLIQQTITVIPIEKKD